MRRASRCGCGWRRSGGFLALVPEEAPPALAALEEACVTGLDAFRAPADAAETGAAADGGLDAVEEENLRRWGYPYVLERFRFHMTLTGPLPPEARAAVRAALEPALAPLLAEPVPVAEICRFAEGGDGRVPARQAVSARGVRRPRRASCVAQGGGGGEADRVDAEGGGGRDVGRAVVDEDRALGGRGRCGRGSGGRSPGRA